MMWSLIRAELNYQRSRAVLFYATAMIVAAVARALFVPALPRDYLLFPALLLFAGWLLHVVVLWGADAEARLSLYGALPVTRVQMGIARLGVPVLIQFFGFAAGLAIWAVFVAGGVVPERAEAIEAAWFLCSANGAALVFLLGWVHLAPEADAAKHDSPALTRGLSVLAVGIALGAGTWALAPWLAPELPPLRTSHAVSAALFHVVAACLVVLNLWLFVRRSELTPTGH